MIRLQVFPLFLAVLAAGSVSEYQWTVVEVTTDQDLIFNEKPSKPVIVLIKDNATLTTATGSGSVVNISDFGNGTVWPPGFNVTCCSSGGRPIYLTQLSLRLGSEEVPDIRLVNNGSHPDDPKTCIQKLITFGQKDDQKLLGCRVIHPALPTAGPEGNPKTESETVKVNVFHKPTPVLSVTGKFVYRSDFQGSKVNLYFRVKANPKPSYVKMIRLNEVKISEDNDNATHPDNEIEYILAVYDTKINTYQYTVTVRTPTKEEGPVSYQIKVENKLGAVVEEVIVTPPDDAEWSGTLWIMIGMSVVMALIFVGIRLNLYL